MCMREKIRVIDGVNCKPWVNLDKVRMNVLGAIFGYPTFCDFAILSK